MKMKTKTKTKTNKIIVVGHRSSGYREVEALLHQCGMVKAQPARRDGMLPQDVTATLCKAHKAPDLDTVTAEEEITQIQPGSVWHGMALDLMLGNLEQPLWGWADPQTIFTLDYWLSLDPQLSFVFVYDEPHRILMEASANDARSQTDDKISSETSWSPVSERILSRLLDNWSAFNSVMLRFHLRNPGRSLLVHTQQAHRAVHCYTQQLQPPIDSPLVLHSRQTNGAHPTQKVPFAVPSGFTSTLTKAGIAPNNHADQALEVRAVERYLIEEVLAAYPSALQLYAELQSASYAPLESTAIQPEKSVNAVAAWALLTRQRVVLAALLQHAQSEKERIAAESDMVLTNLHQVQEELERYYLENCRIQNENSRIQDENSRLRDESERIKIENQRIKQKVAPRPTPAPTGAANRVRRQLSYRLGSVLVQGSSSLGGWLTMPRNMIREVREFRAQQVLIKGIPLPPLHRYSDAFEAERVKKHLSYRVGSVLVKYGKSPWGWLVLPFALLHVVRAFRRQRKEP